MDKITRIHIAKVPYEISITAQHTLEKYLNEIREALEPDLVDETMVDIEVRITEILNDRKIPAGGVIAEKDVDAIQQQLGNPEQFEESGMKKHRSIAAEPKRLLRDRDHAIIGGVASGLGVYLNIDPVIVRIGFIVLSLFWGFGILLYILCWLLVPAAITSSDKLQMRGEPVTAATLQNYRNTAQQAMANLKFRSALVGICKVFRALFTMGAVLFIAVLLSVLGLASTVLYTQPLRPIFTSYHLNYVALSLIWLLCMAIIGIIIVVTLHLWQKRTSSLKVAFVALIGVMVLAVAGVGVLSPFIVDHYKNLYGDNKLAVAVPIEGSGTLTNLTVSADANLVVSYVVTGQPVHATYRAYPGMGKPNISIITRNGNITVRASNLTHVVPECLLDWCRNTYLPLQLTMYGPALPTFTVDGGAALNLTSLNQTNLNLTTRNNASLNIDNSYSQTLNLTAENNGSITARSMIAELTSANVDATSSVYGPVSTTLHATVPITCYQPILFLDQVPGTATVNGQNVTNQSLNQNSCFNMNDLTSFLPSQSPPEPKPIR